MHGIATQGNNYNNDDNDDYDGAAAAADDDDDDKTVIFGYCDNRGALKICSLLVESSVKVKVVITITYCTDVNDNCNFGVDDGENEEEDPHENTEVITRFY